MDDNIRTLKERIGNNIKGLREVKGLNRKEAAAKLGVAHQTLGHYELGRSEPPFEVLNKMVNVYGCSYDDIFGKDSTNKESNDNLMKDVIAILKKNGTLNESRKVFEDLDQGSKQMIQGAINKFISDAMKEKNSH